jgi:hypothetical protein
MGVCWPRRRFTPPRIFPTTAFIQFKNTDSVEIRPWSEVAYISRYHYTPYETERDIVIATFYIALRLAQASGR